MRKSRGLALDAQSSNLRRLLRFATTSTDGQSIGVFVKLLTISAAKKIGSNGVEGTCIPSWSMIRARPSGGTLSGIFSSTHILGEPCVVKDNGFNLQCPADN